VWFFWAIYFTFAICISYRAEENPVKKTLYRNLALIYGIWLFGLPTVSVLSVLVDPWVRDLVLETASIVVSTWAYGFLMFLLWPTRAEEYFNVNKPDVTAPGRRHENYEQL